MASNFHMMDSSIASTDLIVGITIGCISNVWTAVVIASGYLSGSKPWPRNL